jgi:hypothetical protein
MNFIKIIKLKMKLKNKLGKKEKILDNLIKMIKKIIFIKLGDLNLQINKQLEELAKNWIIKFKPNFKI